MIREKFINICLEAIRADEEAGSTNSLVMEPFFRKLIDLAKLSNEDKELKDCFCSIIRGDIEAPYDTLSYCMRALRYEEVVEESLLRLGDPPDPRWMSTHSDIVHAIQDEVWEDADFWKKQS